MSVATLTTHIEQRAAWSPDQSIYLLGPGGVGKSTLGRNLAPRLGLPLVDLDLAFCDAIGQIGQFIDEHGYERYRAENLDLAGRLVQSAASPTLLVLSSGFLVAARGSKDHHTARGLIATGYGITLLPSQDIDAATPIVVERQLGRGFGFERGHETSKFRERFAIYRHAGDMSVVSTAPPDEIAEAVEQALRASTRQAVQGQP